MINTTINGVEYSLPNLINELTLDQFTYISAVLDGDEDNIDKWIKIIEFLGVKPEDMDELDGFTFLELVKEFNSLTDYQPNSQELIESIQVGNHTYTASQTITVRDMALIEKYIKENQTLYLPYVVAILYKNEILSKTEHTDQSHIKHKAKLFGAQLKADIALPIIGLLTKKLNLFK